MVDATGSDGSVVALDEQMHEPTDDLQFNESMYFNFVDGDTGFATLVRMGNRVNEGHAEVTVLVYLPGGGAAIHFDRAAISNNRAFDAGGLRFEVLEPLQTLRMTYSGKAHRLQQGIDLADPKAALGSSPEVPLELDLRYESLIAPYGLSSSGDAAGGIEGAESTIATGHYQGPCRVRGRIMVGTEEWDVTGFGFRDHSWGPRHWQGPRFWRWVSCLCDESNGFVGWLSRVGDQLLPSHGMVLLDSVFERVIGVEISSTYGPAPHYPESMVVKLRTAHGVVEATGEVFGTVPLRNRREGQTARLAEVLCRWNFEGRSGFGISEYHDLIVDGIPVGMTEA